jgi:mannose-6-phosphate isomerase class I
MEHTPRWRATTQELMPARHAPPAPGQYDIYPSFPAAAGTIALGYDMLAARVAGWPQATIDGFGGVLWSELRMQLDAALVRRGVRAAWVDVAEALLPEPAIDRLIMPFLGGDDPLFGMRFTGKLDDFFDAERLDALRPDPAADTTILYGCGAALAGWGGPLVYLDVPKNEIQFRARAGSISNLGGRQPADPKAMYKRCYFVDWPALNAHKATLLPRIDVMVDAQRPDEPALIEGGDLRAALTRMGRSPFRVRPWFEPGPWGGQWIKRHIPQLPQYAPNYAWSFELIVPENGLLLASDGLLLEVSFDLLMYHDHQAVLGEAAERFGYEFPIRFDFLDTFEGGNLSVQCHPRPDYIRRHFGERFTQDETYYILDCAPGAEVFLGFHDDIDPDAFRTALERSFHEAVPVEVERFVQRHPAHRHDLFLIPSGTVHCSGRDSMVLEISATPYIFTFKMYDWMRLGLDGEPRPLNIARAFENLRFERKGERVCQELIARPAVRRQGPGWRIVHLPTHQEHFYDVERVEFVRAVELPTDGSCQVMSLVEGDSVMVEAGGERRQFSYAETFVVPAAASSFTLRPVDERPVMVLKAFVKPGRGPL